MKDFDTKRRERAEKDRDFQIGGESFKIKNGVRPEIMVEYAGLGERDVTTVEVLETVDKFILNVIEEEGIARWAELRARMVDPLTLEDMTDLAEWLVSELTGRPTSQPSDSGGGDTSTIGTSLTGDSLSRVIPLERAASPSAS